MKRLTLAVVVALFGGALSPVPGEAAGDTAKGNALYASCQECHGANGEGSQDNNAPRLAGQHEWYLLHQMDNFRSGVRGEHPEDTFGRQMVAPARELMDKQAIADVVAYILTLEAEAPARTEMTGDPEAGQELGRGCAQCHGTKGQGMWDMRSDGYTPMLTGQHDWYLIRQLENYKAKVRGLHEADKEGRKMWRETVTLGAGKDIRDVVAYIQTLE
jgi:cytochrome c oxidase subunit 2